ncbi:helix-turn-helix transcriptional regulator [Actinosynnema sp. NPDC050801]|uniref:helix-turn-helix domain-containing protein n=1 Tax=unclassified Actinosynnema TaxID=2637065 RepID=UPI0033DC0293
MVNAADETEPPPSGRALLAAELRRLRDLAGWSGRQLAQEIGISQSKVSRIEAGSVIPTLPEVVAWGRALEVSVEMRERLTSLTEAAFTEVHPYRAALQRRGHLQDVVQDEEVSTRWVRTFQASVVPGLLQIPDYARRVFVVSGIAYSDEDLPAAVAGRLHRQLALYEPDRRFDFLIGEAALRWRPGPVKMLLAQLDRLAAVGTLDNVDLGLIPFDREATAPISDNFVINGDLDDGRQSYVSLETVHATLTITGEQDVEMYENRWSMLRKMAVYGDDARALLAEVAADVRAAAG